ASRRPHLATGSLRYDPDFARIIGPVGRRRELAAPRQAKFPAAIGARVLDAPARQSSNTDRPPGQDLGQTVREQLSNCNPPAKERRPSIVDASSLFLFPLGCSGGFH